MYSETCLLRKRKETSYFPHSSLGSLLTSVCRPKHCFILISSCLLWPDPLIKYDEHWTSPQIIKLHSIPFHLWRYNPFPSPTPLRRRLHYSVFCSSQSWSSLLCDFLQPPVISSGLLLLLSTSCYLPQAPVNSLRPMLLPPASRYSLVSHVTSSGLMLALSTSCYFLQAPVTSSRLMLLPRATSYFLRLPLLPPVSCYFLRPHVSPSCPMLLPPAFCYFWVPHVTSSRLPLLLWASSYFLGLPLLPPVSCYFLQSPVTSSSFKLLPPASRYSLVLHVTSSGLMLLLSRSC